MPINDLAAAKIALVRDKGLTPEQADAALRAAPSITQTLDLDGARRQYQADVEAQKQADYAASPAGRREAALQAIKDEEERQATIRGARMMLERTHGDVSALSDAEVLDYTGIEPSAERLERQKLEAEANDLAANLAAASQPIKRQGAPDASYETVAERHMRERSERQ